MRIFLYLLCWVSLPAILSAQTRDCDPVVLKGTALPCMMGTAPEDIIAFRYQAGAWRQIPVQIDEMIELDVAAPYGEATGDCFYKSREDVEWNMLFYADVNTYTGGDVTDPNFDADDELSFMAKDVGTTAPINACPAGVISNTKCQVNVQDPLENHSVLGQIYLFERSGNLAQDAGVDYVNYDFDFGADYKSIYDVCVFEVPGSNPESSRVTTDNYSMHFSRRWVKDELKITAGNASGVDILDQHQYFINVNACNRNENTFSDGKGPIIANIDGPVRGIRSVMGANSGTFMRLDIVFTECRAENKMFYRLHPANGYYDAFDLSSDALGMSFYNDQNPGGVMVDGVRDNLDKTHPNEWELLSGVQGAIVAAYTFETDIQLGTEVEYEQGLVEGFVAAYQSDLGTSTSRKCTGDGASYNANGFCLRTLECTDNRYAWDEEPGCAPENIKYFDQTRYHYFLAPQTTKEQAAQYASFAKNPLVATTNPQNCSGNQQPTCNDGVQNGDETGVDCGGANCPDCPVEPTCEDGIQNGDETGVDCGGADCPACPVEPTCEDGIQNGDETGVDCGGANCPDCSDEPTCEDGIQNGDETGVDCGGANCPACPVEPTCEDGIQNGDEIGVDCGGTNCAPCTSVACDAPRGLFVSENNSGRSARLNWQAVANATNYTMNIRQQGASSWRDAITSETSVLVSPLKNKKTYEWRVRSNCGDEESDWSVTKTFRSGEGSGEPTCEDGIQNGDETGIDCGGANCPDCSDEPTCEDGIQNGDETGIDCGGANCPDCSDEPTCNDGIQNGDETGIDCGGANCPACPVEPTCDDGIQNGDETGVDCGGANCPACQTTTCETPKDLETINIIARRATLDWSPVANAVDYTIEIRPVGNPNWVERTTSNTYFRVQPLTQGLTYEWRVRTNCADESSPFSELVFFVAGSSSGNNTEDRSVVGDLPLIAKAYPSPTRSLLNVQVNQDIQQLEIIDMMGRVYDVQTLTRSNQVQQLNVSALAAGTYWLRIRANGGVKVLRFVKD